MGKTIFYPSYPGPTTKRSLASGTCPARVHSGRPSPGSFMRWPRPTGILPVLSIPQAGSLCRDVRAYPDEPKWLENRGRPKAGLVLESGPVGRDCLFSTYPQLPEMP